MNHLGNLLLFSFFVSLIAPQGSAAEATSQSPPSTGTARTVQAEQESKEAIELKKLKMRKDKLVTENALRKEKARQELGGWLDEKRKLELEYGLLVQRQKMQLAKLELEKNRLAMENALQAEKQKNDIGAVQAEKNRLVLENAVQAEKQKKALMALQAEKDELAIGNALQAEKQKKALMALQAEKDELAIGNALQAEKQKKALVTLKAEKEKLAAENAKTVELQRKVELQFKQEKNKIQMELARLGLEKTRMFMKKDKYEAALAKLRADITLREQKEKWKAEVNREMQYQEEPFAQNILTVSDRRISLNGPIIKGTADFITKRLHYFNNKSGELPIFVVIDRCPGGSVMEGYRILKAMEASKAPIHVVVKSFAASMGSAIVAMAQHSYAYPNAIILHHQPFSVAWGNLTQQKEQLKVFKEWARRLHSPVARKMGISLEEFYKRMYEHNSSGDWQEFADKAQKLKWVDHIVLEIRETGYNRKPTDKAPRYRWFFFSEKSDEKAKRYMRLPRPEPFDFYFLYNPDNYYRWDQ